MTLDPAFQLSFHSLVPGIRVAGESISYAKKFTAQGGALDGEPGLEIGLVNDTNYIFYETTKLIKNGGFHVSSISTLYNNLVLAGLTEVVSGLGLAVNIDALSKIEVSDQEIEFNVKGKSDVLRFFLSAVNAPKESNSNFFSIPANTFPTLKGQAEAYKNNLEERLDDLKAYIDAEDTTLDGRIVDALALLDTEAVNRAAGDTAQQTYTDNAIAALVDSAPQVLDTLKELSDAIGGDDDFITTMSNSLSTKADLAGAVFTGVIEAPSGENKIPFLYASQSDFPSAGSYHGAIAHSHADGAMYFAHAGAWHKLANDDAVNTAIAALQADVDGNETDSDAGIAAEATARGTAITALDTALRALITALQADVDQNESDADSAIGAEQTARTNADTTLQTNITAEATARGSAVTALDARIATLETDPTTAAAVAAVQADVDQNETDSDAADAALSGRLDTLEADPTTATALTALQTAAASARTTLQTTLQAAIDAVQADVNTNESDADTAIATKLGLAGGTLTGNLVVNRDFPDFELKSNGEKRVLFTDAGGGATGAIKNVNSSVDIFAGGVASGNKELSVTATGVEVAAALTLSGGLTDAANDSAAASAGVAVGQLYRNGSVVMIRVS